MKIAKFAGTEETKRLIFGITKDLQREAPYRKHVDFSIASLNKKNATKLVTDENDGVLETISIILMRGFKALITNDTGEITIQKKPIFTSSKKYYEKIMKFLKQVQPDNFNKNAIGKDVEHITLESYTIISKSKINNITFQKITESLNHCVHENIFKGI